MLIVASEFLFANFFFYLFVILQSVPLSAFCWELAHALTVSGPVTILSSDIVMKKLGSSAFDAGHDYRYRRR